MSWSAINGYCSEDAVSELRVAGRAAQFLGVDSPSVFGLAPEEDIDEGEILILANKF
jgi:hypothetical protein